ncbi:MAG TPA: hypothetical protein PKO44_08215, partial [Candidatus Omnitrophota bacterium]|nr:hypothetical protein [Candidatus Omnitrophota bacterium]
DPKGEQYSFGSLSFEPNFKGNVIWENKASIGTKDNYDIKQGIHLYKNAWVGDLTGTEFAGKIGFDKEGNIVTVGNGSGAFEGGYAIGSSLIDKPVVANHDYTDNQGINVKTEVTVTSASSVQGFAANAQTGEWIEGMNESSAKIKGEQKLTGVTKDELKTHLLKKYGYFKEGADIETLWAAIPSSATGIKAAWNAIQEEGGSLNLDLSQQAKAQPSFDPSTGNLVSLGLDLEQDAAFVYSPTVDQKKYTEPGQQQAETPQDPSSTATPADQKQQPKDALVVNHIANVKNGSSVNLAAGQIGMNINLDANGQVVNRDGLASDKATGLFAPVFSNAKWLNKGMLETDDNGNVVVGSGVRMYADSEVGDWKQKQFQGEMTIDPSGNFIGKGAEIITGERLEISQGLDQDGKAIVGDAKQTWRGELLDYALAKKFDTRLDTSTKQIEGSVVIDGDSMLIDRSGKTQSTMTVNMPTKGEFTYAITDGVSVFSEKDKKGNRSEYLGFKIASSKDNPFYIPAMQSGGGPGGAGLARLKDSDRPVLNQLGITEGAVSDVHGEKIYLNEATGTNVLAFTAGANFDGRGNLFTGRVDDSTLALQQGRWTVDPSAKNKINGKDDISVDMSKKLIAYSQGKNDEGLYTESYIGQDMTKGNKKYVSVADSNAFMLTGTFANGKKQLPSTGLHYDLDKTWVYQNQDKKGNFVLPKGTFVRFGDNLKFFVTEKDNGVTSQRKVEYQNTKTKDGKTEAVYGVKNLSFLEAQAGSEDVVNQSVKLDFTTEFGVEQNYATNVVHTDGIVPATLALTSKGSIVQPEAKAEGVTWRFQDKMATGSGDQRKLNVSPKTAVIVTKQDKDGILTTEFLGGENTNKISFKAEGEIAGAVKLREQRMNDGSSFKVEGNNNIATKLKVLPTVLRQYKDTKGWDWGLDVDNRWSFDQSSGANFADYKNGLEVLENGKSAKKANISYFDTDARMYSQRDFMKALDAKDSNDMVQGASAIYGFKVAGDMDGKGRDDLGGLLRKFMDSGTTSSESEGLLSLAKDVGANTIIASAGISSDNKPFFSPILDYRDNLGRETHEGTEQRVESVVQVNQAGFGSTQLGKWFKRNVFDLEGFKKDIAPITEGLDHQFQGLLGYAKTGVAYGISGVTFGFDWLGGKMFGYEHTAWKDKDLTFKADYSWNELKFMDAAYRGDYKVVDQTMYNLGMSWVDKQKGLIHDPFMAKGDISLQDRASMTNTVLVRSYNQGKNGNYVDAAIAGVIGNVAKLGETYVFAAATGGFGSAASYGMIVPTIGTKTFLWWGAIDRGIDSAILYSTGKPLASSSAVSSGMLLGGFSLLSGALKASQLYNSAAQSTAVARNVLATQTQVGRALSYVSKIPTQLTLNTGSWASWQLAKVAPRLATRFFQAGTSQASTLALGRALHFTAGFSVGAGVYPAFKNDGYTTANMLKGGAIGAGLLLNPIAVARGSLEAAAWYVGTANALSVLSTGKLLDLNSNLNQALEGAEFGAYFAGGILSLNPVASMAKAALGGKVVSKVSSGLGKVYYNGKNFYSTELKKSVFTPKKIRLNLETATRAAKIYKTTNPVGVIKHYAAWTGTGAVVGGAVGGIQAKISGEDFWTGALKGASYGAIYGLTGGFLFRPTKGYLSSVISRSEAYHTKEGAKMLQREMRTGAKHFIFIDPIFKSVGATLTTLSNLKATGQELNWTNFKDNWHVEGVVQGNHFGLNENVLQLLGGALHDG